jgi:hypothetical protein
MPLSTIFQLHRGSQVLLMEETGVHSENHQYVASQWQTLSHNVVSSTPRHERDSNSLAIFQLYHGKNKLIFKLFLDPQNLKS